MLPLPLPKVVKPFPKAGVVVVALEKEIRIGDLLCLQRSIAAGETTDANVSGSRWQGTQVCGVGGPNFFVVLNFSHSLSNS